MSSGGRKHPSTMIEVGESLVQCPSIDSSTNTIGDDGGEDEKCVLGDGDEGR